MLKLVDNSAKVLDNVTVDNNFYTGVARMLMCNELEANVVKASLVCTIVYAKEGQMVSHPAGTTTLVDLETMIAKVGEDHFDVLMNEIHVSYQN